VEDVIKVTCPECNGIGDLFPPWKGDQDNAVSEVCWMCDGMKYITVPKKDVEGSEP
jgi:hypothetical protein